MRALATLAGLVVLLAAAAPAGATVKADRGPAKCNVRDVVGGEWRYYGRDLRNTRHQKNEHVVSVADAPFLTPAWTFSSISGGGGGDVTGTPIIAGSCLFFGTNEGWVFALNADTGKLVWRQQVPYGGGIHGSVGVAYGRVYVGVSRLQKNDECKNKRDPCVGPYIVAFNQRTGKRLFATRSFDKQTGADLYGSAVVFPDSKRPNRKKMKRAFLMMGVSGGSAELGEEADRYAFQGSMLFVNPRNGRLLKKTYTIRPPTVAPDEPPDDYAGAGVWSTPSYDRKTKTGWVGGSNPFKPQAEHDHANSILKFGADRRKKRKFGKILANGKGNVDEYIPAFSEMPCFYDVPGNPPPYYPQGLGSCGDIDLSFGASPNLFRGEDGRLLVGGGQKSGVYHVFDAKTMEPVWDQIVGPPTPVGGIVGSTAYDGQSIYGPVTVPGYLWSLDQAGGAPRWIGPTVDGVHWGNAVASANGVIYTTDFGGALNAFDARTGVQLLKKPMVFGTPVGTPLSWGGVSVARHTVYASIGIRGNAEGYVVAYRPGVPQDMAEDVTESGGGDDSGGAPAPGGGDDGGGDGEPDDGGGDDGGGGGGGGSTSIVAGPGAYASSYLTPVATMSQGGSAVFMNYDIAQHDVVAEQSGPDGNPLFRSPLIGSNESAPVAGVERLDTGTYGFFCTLHPGMRGQLNVQ